MSKILLFSVAFIVETTLPYSEIGYLHSPDAGFALQIYRASMATAEFIQLLTSHQSRIYAYILSLVFDPDQADDVLQQTNAVLWEKNSEFVIGTNFVAWSFRVAYFQVMAHRKTLHRDRLVFDDDLIRSVAGVTERSDATFFERQRLLRACLEKLSPRHRDLIRLRYSEGASMGRVADTVGKSVAAVKQSLFRLRTSLIDCVNAAGLPESNV